jgi:hypothetical protein
MFIIQKFEARKGLNILSELKYDFEIALYFNSKLASLE